MKLQNLSIIFLVIIIPLIMIISYYLNLQQDTLKLQAEYDTKLAEATKEGIKAFEVNTVDWSDWTSTRTNVTQRNNAMAAVNTFLTSLANNLNLSGTSREYMSNYIPAVAVTMYDGYYTYAPTYLPITIETSDGLQLYYDEDVDNDGIKGATEGILTTDSENGKNLPVYEPAPGKPVLTAPYKYINSEGVEITGTGRNFVTDIFNADTEYKHMLSNQTAYAARYTKTNTDVMVNYTLDNRIYVYGKVNGNYVEKDGYLVYFNNTKTNLPRIYINGTPINDSNIVKYNDLTNTDYENTAIDTEILEEQLVYTLDEVTYHLETFKYVYDINHEKLYYDETEDNFFTIDSDSKKKQFIGTSSNIKVGSVGCRYKSVSVLWGATNSTTEYKKIYQVLNGRDKGNWYISIKDDSADAINAGIEEIDTQIKAIKLQELGLTDPRFSTIYRDYSAISYYVEAYAFTNWVKHYLAGVEEIKYDETSGTYKTTPITVDGVVYNNIFVIDANNNPEKEDSPIVLHKKNVMKELINSNLNLSISNYGRASYDFKMPILTDEDWEKVFSNISLITFFQGAPIGLKYYNGYAIATSNTNREYVDPGELYFTGNDKNYHRVYCKKCSNIVYTGYRSVEYVLKEYVKYDTVTKQPKVGPIYYYQHDEYGRNENSEIACYYCLVNKENYVQETTDTNKIYTQAKAYNEALARERYYQKAELTAKLGVKIKYHYNVDGWTDIIQKTGLPNDQEVDIGSRAVISTQKPSIKSSNQFLKYVFAGWSQNPNATVAEYMPGANTDVLYEDMDLYAVWTIALSELNWRKDYKFLDEKEAFSDYPNRIFNNTSRGNIKTGSISYIYIDEMPNGNGSRIQMIGNENKPGKGAAWATFDSDFLDVQRFEFQYNLNSGHSFEAAGFLFNIIETGPILTQDTVDPVSGELLKAGTINPHEGTLEGYMLSINFRYDMLNAARSNNGAVFYFKYNKGENEIPLKPSAGDVTLIKSFKLGNYSTSVNSSGIGTISIEVADNGYIINGSELSTPETIDVTNVNPNSFGFFSDHYGKEHGHTCNNVGYFLLQNVKVTVVRDR